MRPYSLTEATTVIYTFQLGIKEEIADFMRMGMEDECRRFFVGT